MTPFKEKFRRLLPYPARAIRRRHLKKLGAFTALTLLCFFSLPFFFSAGQPQAIPTLTAGAVAAEGRLIPIYSVDTKGEKLCSLTFDAAWGATRTLSILDILDEKEIKATFFLTNIWMKEYPDMVKEIAARGHEVGLHSDSHPNLTTINNAQLQQEIDNNRNLLKELTGVEAKVFRPPFGAYDNRVVQKLMDEGLAPIQWSADSLDWKELSAAEMLVKLKKDISPGGIVLFHNDGLHTPEVLPPLIDYLVEQGYSFKTVSDLILPSPWTVNNQGVQKPAP